VWIRCPRGAGLAETACPAPETMACPAVRGTRRGPEPGQPGRTARRIRASRVSPGPAGQGPAPPRCGYASCGGRAR
jgi:hypothetical protein